MRLLTVNGNRSPGVTARAVEEAHRAAAPDTEIRGVTARLGANYVRTRADAEIAAHAVLDALAGERGTFDAAVLAISFDPGLFAARQLLDVPVVGMTEASFAVAGLLGERFAVITAGEESRPLYMDLVRRYGVEGRLSALYTLDTSARTDLLDVDGFADAVVARVEAAARAVDVGSVVLCGAVFAGMARRLRARIPVPLIDGIASGVALAQSLYRMQLAPLRTLGSEGREMAGLSPALTALFTGGPGEEGR